MSDLISRDKALKDLTDIGVRLLHIEVIKAVIENQPAIDAVPVVHCKDCKQWGCGLPMETDYVKCCGFGGYMVGKEGYCVYGELRSSAK